MVKDPFAIDVSKKNKVSSKDGKIQWVEDSHISNDAGEGYVKSNFESKYLRYFLFLTILFLAALLSRVAYLQVIRGEEYRTAAEENRIRITEIKAPRGIIYDRNGKVLAHNIPNFTLRFTPADFPDDQYEKDIIIQEIADILQTTSESINEIINKESNYSYQSKILQDHIPYNQAILLKIASVEYPGITLEATTFREYLADSSFAHVLGYMGKITDNELGDTDYSLDDYLGKAGVELSYEDKLRGTSGQKEIEVDSLGKESKIIAETKPLPGQSLTLTIDYDLQKLLGELLTDTVESSRQITGAAALAMDPQNGEILAIVSNPSFDNNAFTLGITREEYEIIINDPQKPLFNRTVLGEYPPGSIIKPLIALSGLDKGIINANTSFMSTGGIQIGQWFFPDWKAGGHGSTNVTKALAESVNTFFYIVGGGYEDFAGLGVDTIKEYLEKFNLNTQVGIDLPSEASGFLPDKAWKEDVKEERWYIGDTYHLAIGQGHLLVTPLQVASYTATIANYGTLYKPHLAKYFSNPKGEIITKIHPEVIREGFIGENHYATVRTGLREAVLSGSAQALRSMNIAVAGKTGTAQFGSDGKTHAWFTCFAPYENPTIALTVLVEQGGEGHTVALPIAKAALEHWFKSEEGSIEE